MAAKPSSAFATFARMRRLGQLIGVVALLLVALAIGGCGGGDDEPEETTPAAAEPTALSKEELIAQGEAICAEVNAAVGTVGSTTAGGEGQASQVADLYGGLVERLKGLGAPSDDRSGYDEFIGSAEQLAQAESDVALAAGRGEAEALASAEAEAAAALDAFQSAAETYGLEQCTEAPSAPVATPAGEAGGAEEEESGAGAVEEEAAPEAEEEAAPEETGGAGAVEEESAGGGAAAGGGGSEGSGGGSSGGIGPG